ncbi:db6da314-ed34-44a1-8dce-eef96f1ab9fc [Thermothielavioides terrestris]|uniref:Db6da314-ed34-44a1-8dce-eef96f1ab9fc n=1 Tax=Thermothielavioides terrestris TaxID=2587410 RepID=A0A3S4BLX5_9PEZI|nr:db6da314-ed34-44a1-8dce-eef96f1ab9fc [Thermothielavioides terrestris]
MDGTPHVLGGLVEESLGCKGSLFAKQVQGDPSAPTKTRVSRHEFWSFPPPDMGEHNREFARELEESLPVVEGFDADFIDTYVERYAERSVLFANAMQDLNDTLDVVLGEFLSIKKQLSDLNDTRESSISDAYARVPKLTPAQRKRVLAEVALAEAPLVKEREVVQHDLMKQVLHGRGKIAHALLYDFRAAKVIEESRTRAEQRKVAEEHNTELGTAGTMLGLRGSLSSQDNPTRDAIMQNARFVVNERMGASSRPGQPDEPAFIPLASNLDILIARVPDWFSILDAKGTVELHGATPLDRYKELIQALGDSFVIGRDEEGAAAERPARPFTKEFHEPNPAWPDPKQRQCGGSAIQMASLGTESRPLLLDP